MAPAYLKKTFGGRLAFHGMISTAGPVAYGTPDEVGTCVKDTLAIMMPGNGYCLAPTHQLQDNSPTENVVAMYEAAREYEILNAAGSEGVGRWRQANRQGYSFIIFPLISFQHCFFQSAAGPFTQYQPSGRPITILQNTI